MQKVGSVTHNQKKNQSIETDPEMIALLQSAGKDWKAAITNMFKGSKKNVQ